jgi:hypothetical protein
MEFLEGFVCLTFFVAFVAAVIGIVCLVQEDLRSGFVVVFRQMRQARRFGLLTLLQLLAVFALTFSMLRCGGVFQDIGGEVLVLGFVALVFAIGVVTGVHLVLADVGELFKRPRKHDEPSLDDAWDDGREKKELQIEPLESRETPDCDTDGDAEAR